MHTEYRKVNYKGVMSMRFFFDLFLGFTLLSIAACDEDGASTSSNNIDTAIEDGFIRNVEAEVSERVATVVTVRWTTEAPATGFVEYGIGETLAFSTPEETEPGTVHEAMLLGLTGNTEITFRITADTDDETITSRARTVKTKHLPNALPVLSKEGDDHDFYTITTIIGAVNAVVILNGSGEYVWYHLDDRDLDMFRARLSSDGRHILYNAGTVAGDPDDPTELVRVSLDGSSVTTVPLPLLAHDFVEHADGTLGAIVAEIRDVDGEAVQGNRIVEIAPDGNETEIWSTWDCFDPATLQGDEITNEWTLANALDFDPEEDVYYLGMRHLSSIVKIDRATGTCRWVLGSAGETLTFADGSRPFLHQHQFHVLDDSILILDNDGPLGHQSRVVEYALDLSAGTATEIWSYMSDPPVHTFVLGEPTRLESGETFVNWSAAGLMERVSSNGTAKWRLGIDGIGYAFGFHTLEGSLFR